MFCPKSVKLVTLAAGICLFLWLVSSQFLGPGLADGSYPLLDGYELLDSGGDGVSVVYVDSENRSRDIVGERVDDYKISGNTLFVARRPRECHRAEDGALDCKVSTICEYWMIDTKKHIVQRTDKASDVRCK